MPTNPTGFEQLPVPLAFVAGVLSLLVWLIRELTRLMREWNDTARAEAEQQRVARLEAEQNHIADLEKERAARIEAEERHAKDLAKERERNRAQVDALGKDMADLRQEVEELRDEVTRVGRASHQREVALVRDIAQRDLILARHGLDPEGNPLQENP